MKIKLIILFTIQVTCGQSNYENSDWDKILIGDVNGWTNIDYKFQIKKDDYLLTPLNKPDSIIKKIEVNLISDLINLLNKKNDSFSPKKSLNYFGKDSLWLELNAEKLWGEYKKDKKTTNELDSIAINIIKETEKANKITWSLQGFSSRIEDYPLVYIHIIRNKDTLSAYSNGQYPFMFPWRIKERKVYDYRISKIIAELLPDKIHSNKERLNGEKFNNYFLSGFYQSYIKNKENYLEAKKRYSRDFRSLEKVFEIKNAEIGDMSSIEWGGDYGRNCLEMSLNDSKISKNIEFYTVFGTNKLFNSPKSILYRKEKLISLLNKNPVYNYALNCNDCLGEIHWVKSNSFSLEARKNFKEDLVNNGIDENKYNGRYKDAIFFELNENRNDVKSFSRWIFLKDETFILWQLKGNYLMNLPQAYVENQGYICKEIDYDIITTINDENKK